MTDRFHFSQVPLDHLEHFEVQGGIEWLLAELDLEEGVNYTTELLGCCTNLKPGDDGSSTYFLERVTVGVAAIGGEYPSPDDVELLACTCPAFRFQQIPKPDHVERGVVGIDQIGDCKHLRAYKKLRREYEEPPEQQATIEGAVGGDGGGDGE